MTKKQQYTKSPNHRPSAKIKPPESNNGSALKPRREEQLPTIQNMLEIKKEERGIRTAQYFAKTKQFIHSYMQKKVGSRVIQLMFKWGDEEIKSSIFKTMIKNWKQLIKSKYALHTISTVSDEYEFPRIVNDAIILQNNKQGSMVLARFMQKHPQSPKVTQIINKFEEIKNQITEKGLQSQEVLHNLAMKSIEKQYYYNKLSKIIIRLGFTSMLESQRGKIVQFFSSRALSLLNDNEGVKLFVCIYNYFDSKQKKQIVKQLRNKISDVLEMSHMAYIALIKIITQTDDTVMIGNRVIPELLSKISDISNKNSKMYNILISLLCPRSNNLNLLGKLERIVPYSTCKKDEESRMRQIRLYIYPTLISYLTESSTIANTCKNANESRLALGLLKTMQIDYVDGCPQLEKFIKVILKYFIDNLKSLKVGNDNGVDIGKTLVAGQFGSKLVKNMLLVKERYVDKYCQQLEMIFKDNLEMVLNSNASFVLVALIERGRNELLDEIRKSKIELSKVRLSDFYMSRINAHGK